MEFSLREMWAGRVLCGPEGEETTLFLTVLISAKLESRAPGSRDIIETRQKDCRLLPSRLLHPLCNLEPVAFVLLHLSHLQ